MIYVICNPIAGNGRGKKAGERIRTRLTEKGIDHRMLWTERPGHASDLAKEACESGGDCLGPNILSRTFFCEGLVMMAYESSVLLISRPLQGFPEYLSVRCFNASRTAAFEQFRISESLSTETGSPEIKSIDSKLVLFLNVLNENE